MTKKGSVFIGLAVLVFALIGYLYSQYTISSYSTIEEIEKALSSSDVNSVQRAVYGLEDFPSKKAKPLLMALWLKNRKLNLSEPEQKMIRIEVAGVLLFFGEESKELENFIFRNLSDSDKDVKQAAILALAQVNNDKAIHALEKIILEDARFSEVAILTLATIAISYPTNKPLQIMEQLAEKTKSNRKKVHDDLEKKIVKVKSYRLKLR